MARKILLADDSVTAQNMGRKILADAGYEVITVNNGSAALKKIGEQHPDVIVLDVYMPGYSGLEVCQRLKDVGETSRIPILLTVGKLEPFKPEEARRVRADAFIVKPFEASELLSALTKLEDKIVPHSESAKTGRFGRSAIALDDPHFDRTMVVEEDDGWKSRLNFPPKKKEKEEADEKQPAAQPVAAQPAPTVADKKKVDEKLDLGALSGAGLPKDVTPEEIAALAAAAARIKGKVAEDKAPAAEMPVVAPSKAEEQKAEAAAPGESTATPQSMAGPGPIYVPEQKQEAKEPTKESAAVEPPAEAKASETNAAEKPAESPVAAQPEPSPATPSEPVEEPATTVVSSAAESARWTAVSVALAPEDSAVSLEQEMQKAFAASAGAEGSQAISASMAVPVAEAASMPSSSPAPETLTPEPEPITNAATDLISAAVSELETVAGSFAATSPQAPSVSAGLASAPSAEMPPSSAPAESSKVMEVQKVEPAPVAIALIAEAAAAESVAKKQFPSLEPIPTEAVTQASPASSSSQSESHDAGESPAESTEVANADLNLAAEAALARNTGHESGGAASSSSADSSNHESRKEESAAMAAAVGGKTSVEENKSDADSDPDVASIVDSVLANLRPKIVQEISRKLGKK